MKPRILIATGVLALAAAGCGSAPSSAGVASVTTASAAPTASPSPSASVDKGEQSRKFAACLRENGLDVSDPDPNGEGMFQALPKSEMDSEKVKKAMQACRSVAPVRDAKELSPEDQEKMRQFAACMRKNGVDMPDPDASGAMAKGTARNFKPDDPAFKKAYEACRGTFPKLGQAK
ncbi:hypothetical protein [Nonomuraea guangzhouensis]|uniref:Lipoprotein n=1 Tax=Nonomuraea guangzhouensis TaxID=1291555 RepID=A0ABW4GBI9_9ACTN|nr:hypothetical protein [Nonomuraea guangzhouensis]